MSRYTAEWYADDPRFDAITACLGSPPARVLDFGAFSTAMAEKFVGRYPQAEVVVVDDTITTPSSDRIRVVAKRATPADIGKLAGFDGFDVTLALSVLHHVTQWRKYLAALRASAPLLFVETANPAEVLPKAKAHKYTADMVGYLSEIGEAICLTDGYDDRFQRTLWLVRG